MFSKLFKYEMKAVSRIFLLAWPALLVLALMTGFFGFNADRYPSYANGIVTAISAFLFAALFIGIIVMTIIIIIMRFYKGLLKEEGYLTFTLPVTTRQILCAKGLSATLLSIGSSIVATLAVILCMLPAFDDFPSWAEIFKVLSGWEFFIGELIVLFVLSLIATIYQIYAAMAIGHMAVKHKIACSFGAYIGISVVLTVITSIAGGLYGTMDFNPQYYEYWSFYSGPPPEAHIFMIVYILAQVAQVVIFHIVCELILSKKLNLE